MTKMEMLAVVGATLGGTLLFDLLLGLAIRHVRPASPPSGCDEDSPPELS